MELLVRQETAEGKPDRRGLPKQHEHSRHFRNRGGFLEAFHPHPDRIKLT